MSALKKHEDEMVRLHSEDDLRSYSEHLSGHGPLHETVARVDPDDDITSVRGKLESARTIRVVLLIPATVKVLTEGLEFRVLRRLQRELGIDLIIVSDDLHRRGLAKENGFRKIFGSLKAYYRNKSATERQDPELQLADREKFAFAISIGRWGIAMVVIVAALLGLAAYLAMPVAKVVTYPQAQTMARDIQINVDVGGPPLDVTAQRLSGRVVQEKISVSASVPVIDGGQATSGQPQNGSGLQEGINVTIGVRDALREKLVQTAMVRAREELRGQVRSNESLPDASIRTDISGERYDHNIGDVTDTLGGTLDVTATGVVFNNDDFNKLVNALWSQEVPRTYGTQGELNLGAPAVLSAEGQHMLLRVRASGTLLKQVDPDAVVVAVRGRTLKEAEAAVAKTGDFSRPAQFSIWPAWANRAFRVDVVTAVDVPGQQTTQPPSNR